MSSSSIVLDVVQLTVYMCLMALAGCALGGACDSLVQVPCLAGIVATVLVPIMTSLPDLVVCYSSFGASGSADDLEAAFGAMAGSIALIGSVGTGMTLLLAIAVYGRRTDLEAAAAAAAVEPTELGVTRRSLVHLEVMAAATKGRKKREVHPALGLLRLYSDVLLSLWLQLFFLLPAASIHYLVSDEWSDTLFQVWQVTSAVASVLAFVLYVLAQARRGAAKKHHSPSPEAEPIFEDTEAPGGEGSKEDASKEQGGFTICFGPFQLLYIEIAPSKTDNEVLLALSQPTPKKPMPLPLPLPPPAASGGPSSTTKSNHLSLPLSPEAVEDLAYEHAVEVSARSARRLSAVVLHPDGLHPPPARRKHAALTRVQRLHLCWGLFCATMGTVVAFLAGGPLMDAASRLAATFHLPPFALPFVVGAIAANAPDLVIAATCVTSPSAGGLSIALGSLLGGVVINCTLCLALLLSMAAQAGMQLWFPADSIAIVLGQTGVLFILARRVLRRKHALMLFALYPATIVAALLFDRLMRLPE